MPEQVVGYRVRVYDMGKNDPWDGKATVLYEQDFMYRVSDPPGYRGGEALRRAELNAQHVEQLWPGNYVEVDCIWKEVL